MLISDWSSDVCSSDLLDSAIMRPDAIIAAALLPHVEHDHDTLRPDRHRHLRDQLGIADSRGADRNLLHAKADDRLRLPGGLHPPRSDARRVGTECVSTGRTRGSTYH